MKIHKGDSVRVIAGKDRGKSGKVLRALPKRDWVLVEGVNIRKRHQRATKANQKGQIIDKTMPIHVSNVMLMEGGKPTRHRSKAK
ncbi:MAG TPA: 50S ribosomal protein L24 [Candidatus Paceibacterota bacterium]